MNEIKAPPPRTKESLDAAWIKNLNKLEGPLGTDILVNDSSDIISRLIKAVKDRGSLPCDMDNPETMTEVEEVNEYAQRLYDLCCEGAAIAEDMMVGEQVEREFNNIMDGLGETRNMYDETGHKRSDF